MNKYDVKILNPYNFFYKNASQEKMIHSFTDNHPNEEANYLMAQYNLLKSVGLLNSQYLKLK